MNEAALRISADRQICDENRCVPCDQAKHETETQLNNILCFASHRITNKPANISIICKKKQQKNAFTIINVDKKKENESK